MQNAHEAFEAELEKALVARINYIIVEPARLGDETARWIRVGNCLHKTAVVSGLASIVTASLWPERFAICAAPLCAISVFCTGLYTVSWNYDPCCQYQVRKEFCKWSFFLALRFILIILFKNYSEIGHP